MLEASAKKVVAVVQSGEEIAITGRAQARASALAAKANRRRRSGAAPWSPDPRRKGDWSLTQLPEVEGVRRPRPPYPSRCAPWSAASTTRRGKFQPRHPGLAPAGPSFNRSSTGSLEKGFTPATVINDRRLFFEPGRPAASRGAEEYDGTFDGPMSMRRGLRVEEHYLDPGS